MEELPLALLSTVPDAERGAVQQWWAALSPADQCQVADLCDPGWEECFFGPAAGDAPLVTGGRFLAHDDAWRLADWEADWREYLAEHPARSLGDRWAEGSVLLASQFETTCRLDSSGIRCRIAEWGRTRFGTGELPPSEQRRAEPRTAADRGLDGE